MRPDHSRGNVVGVLDRELGERDAARRTAERLHPTVRCLAAGGLVEASLLSHAQPQCADDRLLRLVAGIKAAGPDHTLLQIAAQIEAMQERTRRGGTRWHRSSVKDLLGRAARLGPPP